ncbi:MAG: replicative helicase [Actinomycetota bacterium]|nr:replicative helicase [Actinomycetota bacterium]
MSVAEFPSAAPTTAQFERTPPQDLIAEQSVLGGMLLSKDAIADVVEVVRGHDFYRPAHELVYEAVLDLYGRGEPADAVTVAAELQKRGELGRVGGGPYLHTLISSVPTAANAGYYARIVRETAILRRLIEAGTKIVQMGFTGDGDADDVVDAAQAEVYAVTDRRTSEDYLPLSAIMEGTLDEIEAIGSRGGEMVGVPTGFADFDELTNGLHPGQMIVVAARPAVGKALALDTPLATPEGWTTMGEVRVGDRLLGADGLPTTVIAATPVLEDRRCYEVVFSDGTTIVADGEHGWLTDTRASRKSAQAALVGYNGYRSQRTFASVKTTEEIARTLRLGTGDKRLNHSVKNAAPLGLPEVPLPLAPYALGVWLGDGHSSGARFTSADPEIAMYIEAEGLRVSAGTGLDDQGLLRTLGLLGNKHIPAVYLRASERQRRDLLAGLLDTDGTVTAGGSVQFAVTCERLAMNTRELIVSLGYKCGLSTKCVKGRRESSSIAYTLTFSTNDDVFRLPRKRLVHKERRSGRSVKIGSRNIIAVRRITNVPVRCVEVDNAEHLYLAGPTMIPTHNSTLGLDVARSAAIKHQLATCIFSLEMSRNEITMRLLSAEARVPLHHMRTGKLTDDDWTRLARRMGEVSNAPLFIDDSPNMSMMEIRAKCRRLKQRHDLKLVVIDYLQLMSSGKRVESRQQEVSEFSRALKLLAKELEVPVIAISQLNRASEQRTDKKPQMSDLRESGCLPASTYVTRADTGARVTLGELLAAGARDIPVWSLDEKLRYRPRTMTSVFPSGRKEVFALTLASGKSVQATANHPFLTYAGWRPLGELRPGSRVAVPRHLPAPLETVDGWADADVAALRGAPALPDEVAQLPKRQISLLLWHLWQDRGVVDADSQGRGVIALAAGDRALAETVARLLLRFGISVTIRGDSVEIAETDDQRRFLQEIGFPGLQAARMLRRVLAETSVRGQRSRPQDEVWTKVHRLFEHRPSHLRHGFAAADAGDQPAGDTAAGAVAVLDEERPRAVLGELAATLAQSDLEITATNDVLWDCVVSITSLGEQDVFDATVPGTHNFVADGVAVHNSIEQDADMVVLLHREELYERESPRAGEADFIVAKHRNGPTATITVAFQGHYSRFVDMAQS